MARTGGIAIGIAVKLHAKEWSARWTWWLNLAWGQSLSVITAMMMCSGRTLLLLQSENEERTRNSDEEVRSQGMEIAKAAFLDTCLLCHCEFKR
eukprot:87321-Rhodomonas_salina.1